MTVAFLATETVQKLEHRNCKLSAAFLDTGKNISQTLSSNERSGFQAQKIPSRATITKILSETRHRQTES
jgi:hypothetical protein